MSYKQNILVRIWHEEGDEVQQSQHVLVVLAVLGEGVVEEDVRLVHSVRGPVLWVCSWMGIGGGGGWG